MTDKALMMLMARAPKRIDLETSRKWHAQFYKDYPPPPKRTLVLANAKHAVYIATNKPCAPITPHPRVAWNAWYEECHAKFVNDWPAIWARQMLEITKCTSQ